MMNTRKSKKNLLKLLSIKNKKIKFLKKENKRLWQLANIDNLTNTLSRRAGVEFANKELANARKNNLPLTVCFLDVDNLKGTNDRLGHKQGDKLLFILSLLIKKTIRKNDIFFRYGGDEFIITFPNTTINEAKKIMNRVLKTIKKINDSQIFKFHINISFGFSQYFVGKNFQINDLINLADKEMYKNK